MIPRRVHLIWFGDDPPADYLAGVDEFATLNPRWRIRWWHERDIARFKLINADLFDAAPDLVPDDSVYQFQSDLARYEILHRLGGVYCDLDYHWFKPIDPLVAGHRLVTTWEQQLRWVANGFIATTAHHPALLAAAKQVRVAVAARRPGNRANRLSGPHVWTPVAKSYRAHIWHQRVLHAVPWTNPDAADQFDPTTHPDAYGVHRWGHQRLLREQTA